MASDDHAKWDWYLRKAFGVAVPVRDAQSALRLLRRLKLVDSTLRFARTGDAVLIPLECQPHDENSSEVKQQFPKMQVTEYFFEETRAKPRTLSESLHDKIPERLLPYLPHSFDIIGEIAVVEISQELAEFSSAIGEGVLEINPHLRLVLRKSSEVSGKFRTRKFEAVAGIGSTETVHKEFSCLLELDVAKVYFNPRLSHERMRIAGQVKEDEHILDMFAGVGPYSILIAKTRQSSKVCSVDINPEAFRYLERNILLNRVADRVVSILGDAGKLAETKLSRTADRVIMNLPSESSRFLEAAVKALKEEGGVVHYYVFASRTDSVDEIKKTVGSAIESLGRTVHSFTFSDIIKEVAPGRVQVALDIVVK